MNKIMYDYLLPIGSVVNLKKDKRLFMIYGLLQSTLTNPAVTYDYIAVPYPVGLTSTVGKYLINHDDIGNVLFEGFRSEYWEKLIVTLNNNLDKTDQ